MVKYKILESLRNEDSFVSGQELSKELGISRTAIWKHIGSLRRDGYVINASPRKGYLLKKVPDLLLPRELERALNNKIIGKKVIHYDAVESTIEVAKKLKKDDKIDGTVIVAEKQTNGKGRFGRSWVSSKGGVWLSVILLPVLDPIDAPKLNIVASMSVVNTIEELGLNAQVKWPNDILINGKKVAGVLIHMNAELDKINYAIVSIGINVNNRLNDMPKDVSVLATTLKAEIGRKIKRVDLTTKLLTELEKNYNILFENNFNNLLDEWKKRCVTFDNFVSVKTVNGVFEGIAKNIDEYGRLLLHLDSGQEKLISSGEATILKQPRKK